MLGGVELLVASSHLFSIPPGSTSEHGVQMRGVGGLGSLGEKQLLL